MRLWIPFAAGAGSLLLIASFVGVGWDAPPVQTEQIGYRGSGMYISKDIEKQAELVSANVPPESPYEPDVTGTRAKDVYENVQILGDLSEDQFNHFMASITEWVAPVEGCNYCHNPENMASDELYQKVVARRMIQMTQKINVDWQSHVAQTGVTCYTCHRGNNIPKQVWYRSLEPKPQGNMTSNRSGQNVAAVFAGNTSMPQNALEDYLLGDKNIRVHSTNAYPDGKNPNGTKETEGTWALMLHMSESLGANCVTCHNSRAFNDWDQSPPQRVTAWHGIRMARELNNNFMVGMTPVFPANRLGPEGDVYKIGCATCHNGVQKPLYGVSMLKDYMDSLAKTSNTDVPDYTTYEPGKTMMMAPGKTSLNLDKPAGTDFAKSETVTTTGAAAQ